ncbi:hypothetical protein [Nostoc sp.]|uniref:hypothetical protein n=1 Tax=Nostoc sp. TaxID=1180 RepID=UPI002FF7D311
MAALAQTVTALLAPALPILVKVGDGALEKIGSDISDKAKTLWVKLRPTLAYSGQCDRNQQQKPQH